MRNGKLQVYLDSDDYSKLSDPKVLAKEPRKKKIRDYLLQLVEKNIIEIRYSALTISEMIHADESVRYYAVQRAELLASLSRGKVFLPIYDLFFGDELKLIPSIEMSMNYAYGEENNWLDYSKWHASVEHFQNFIASKLREYIKRIGLSRQQRKQLEKRLIKDNRFVSACIDVIINSDHSTSMKTGTELALCEELTSKEKLVEFLKGNVSAKTFFDEIFSKMMDVQFVIQKASELEPELQRQMRFFINNQGCNLRDACQRITQEIADAEQKLLDLGIEEEGNRLRKRYPSLIQKSLLDARTSILTKYYEEKSYTGISSKEWHERVTKSKINSIPSLDLYLSLMKQFILERIRNKQQGIYLSDGPDLLHAGYAPYCDIIRVDKRTHDLVGKLPVNVISKLNAQFLKRPEDLPDAIEEKL